MNVHYLQHVAYEGIGSIREWAEIRGHALAGTLMFAQPAGAQADIQADAQIGARGLPRPDDVDMLVVMGGSMNVYETDEHPWLLAEKDFIGACVASGKTVLGICLGAQLIADVLGGQVTPAPYQEIGWYPVYLTETGRGLEAFAHFSGSFTVLHWHGDTFSIPDGAAHAATSAACPNQAFAFDGARVIGLQFHLEETPESLADLVGAAGPNLPDGPWISGRAGLLAPDAPFAECKRLLFGLLDRMAME